MTLAARRLPGIRIDVAPPAPAETLPRMDVAVFVGFAATGPLHRPVAVESVGQYAAVFGSDASLAWDVSRGEPVLAHLGPAVRAFFSNGGSRCWVIRVARSAELEAARHNDEPTNFSRAGGIATTNVFAIPGVLAVHVHTSEIMPARANARCEGSWSDPMRVSTALAVRGFGIADYAIDAASSGIGFSFHTSFALEPGDLIAVDGGDDGVSSYAVVNQVGAALEPGGAFTVRAAMCACFSQVDGVDSPTVPGLEHLGRAVVSGVDGEVDATLMPVALPPATSRLRFESPVPSTIERGQWVRWTDGADVAWMRIDEITQRPALVGSPRERSSTMIEATVSGAAWYEREIAAPATLRGGHRLTLELRAGVVGDDFRLTDTGLTPSHPRAWWNQSSDAEFYRPADAARTGPTRVIATEAPRFPLAPVRLDQPIDDDAIDRQSDRELDRVWIPLGVEPLFGARVGPMPPRFTALERDGLAAFDAGLFLDPELAETPVDGIAELADSIRFLRTRVRPVLGMHAALSIGPGGLFNEASLLVIPDAVHVGWHRRQEREVASPRPKEPAAPAHWRTHRGPCGAPDTGPLDRPDFGEFLDCDTRVLRTPELDGPGTFVPPGAYVFSWAADETGAEYVLMEATQDDFADEREVHRGPDAEFVAFTEREGVYFYRLYATRGSDRSGTSNVVVVQVRRADWIQEPPEADAPVEAEWLAIHRAAVRLAGATGELFAVLAMPRHFRTGQALRYAARLRVARAPAAGPEHAVLGVNEARALSYGALYFPWVEAARGGSAGLRVVPADGALAGVLAARARERGAWIAPANEPLRDVVALSPTIAEGDWLALQDAQINVVRNDPRGLFTLSADTLSLDDDVRPINVRRLLTLLRRLALRRGSTFVFEPNGPVLRRAVQRTFGVVLGDLFRRGAFAGATPAQSFRVVTDDTINTPRDIDAGRFFVELRVAPAVPMRFLSVRLAQTGERLTVIEEL